MHRREFLGTGAAGLLAATQAVTGPALAAAEPGAAFRDLPEERSKDGLLRTVLDMREGFFDVGGRRLRLYSYNGELPGRIMRLRPGDRLEWTLINNMHKALGLPLKKVEPNPVANYTNVHTHGLQVSPGPGADNVYITIPPGEPHAYAYDIPGPASGRPQPAGMHWYHPHRHGSTSHQGWQGLSGPIIIEGDIDEVPEVREATERVMVLNELWVNDRGETPSTTVVPNVGWSPFTPVPSQPTDMLFPINGVMQPDIGIGEGETQRWRVLAAGPHRFFHLQIDGHVMYQISQDGIPFTEARPMQRILLAPGNRAEFIIKGGRPGRYPFRALAYEQGHPGGMRPERILGTLVVGPGGAEGRLPGKLVAPVPIPDDAREPIRERTVVFKGDISGVPVKFYLDGKPFSANRIDQTVLVGTTEDWTLVNEDVFQHPFHIHVNPFQVVEINGQPTEDPTWWDTFAIPSKGSCKIRMYFRPDVTGLTVYHCHILPHEDNGMMANILLYAPPPGFGPASAHASHGGG